MRERKRIRLRNYDYSNPGKYFVTICTQKMEPYFGKIENSKILLSKVGEIANQFWGKIPLHFKNVKLHEFVIMPDHMHGIIEIIAGKKDTASIDHKSIIFGPQKKGSLPAVIGQY
jgi:REP element-mobilizing transposase RayT